jgi:YesN/AraC family two-component response regulator
MMNLHWRHSNSASIDYLLKPIDEEDLTAAVSKLRAITKTRENTTRLWRNQRMLTNPFDKSIKKDLR